MQDMMPALLPLLLASSFLWSDEAEDKALAAIEKLGGKVARDAKTTGNPVVRVSLLYSKVTDEQLVILGALKNLQDLDLFGTKLTDDGLKHLRTLQNLRTLNLAFTRITDAVFKDLRELKNLHTLSLGETKVTGAGLKELRGLQKLRALHLDGAALTD